LHRTPLRRQATGSSLMQQATGRMGQAVTFNKTDNSFQASKQWQAGKRHVAS